MSVGQESYLLGFNDAILGKESYSRSVFDEDDLWASYRNGYWEGLDQLVKRGILSEEEARKRFGLKSESELTGESGGEIRTTSSTGGQKGVKPQRYDLIPVHPLNLLAELYGKGAEKYEAHNYRRGYEYSKSYAAAMRHMTAFWNGEDIDPEMGVPHVICAAFHMFALAEFLKTHPEFDDRFIPEEQK